MSRQLLKTVIVASYFSRRVTRDFDALKTRQSLNFEVVLRRQDQVKSLYRMWAETNQGILFVQADILGKKSALRTDSSRWCHETGRAHV
jgi:hypothetical protein